jgi:undecaprenyl-diphosphatase
MNKKIVISVVCILFFQSVFSQGQWEVDMVRNINPNPPTSNFWKNVSGSAGTISVGIPTGMLLVSIINHDKKLQKQSFEVFGSLVISTVTTQLLKRIVNRPRPYESYNDIYPDEFESGKSFPSGHTTTAFSTATSLTLTTKKWYIAVPAFAWATSVGYSRMYLGEHYPSDVLMGAAVGTASAFASQWIMKKIILKKKETIKQIP